VTTDAAHDSHALARGSQWSHYTPAAAVRTFRRNEKLHRAGPGPALALASSAASTAVSLSHAAASEREMNLRRIGAPGRDRPKVTQSRILAFLLAIAEVAESGRLHQHICRESSCWVAAHGSVTRLHLGEHPGGVADAL
jgi:hypothetical protein